MVNDGTSFRECLSFANSHRFCTIATVDRDQPRVRIVRLWFADDTGFYFQCGTYKPYYKQLQNNKKVEVCFFNKAAITNKPKDENGEPLKVLRVAGKIEFIDDMELRARCIKDTPAIMKITGVTGPEDRGFAVFRIYSGEAYFWDRDSIEKESGLKKIKF